MHASLAEQTALPQDENISGTLLDFGEAAKRDAMGNPVSLEERCVYIAADSWPPGAPPYCAASVEPGSSYCALHRRLCVVDPASADGARIAEAQDLAGSAAPLPVLTQRVASVLPEPTEEEEKLDVGELSLAPGRETEER